MHPFVSIITPVKSESRYIVECVNSLLNIDYPKSSYEVIVVLDSKATKDVEKALKTFSGKIKIIKNTRTGSAANRNLGVQKADRKAKYLAFTDADCIVSKTWVSDLVKRMENAEKSIGCIGGLNLVPSSDSNFAKLVGALEQTMLGGGGSAQSSIAKKERFVPSIPNCNALYRKELWAKNRQDTNLIIGQDGEFNYRLSQQGNKFLVVPGAVVWHHRTSTFTGYIKRMFRYGEAAARIFKLHPGILKVRWYALLSLAGMLAVILLLILSHIKTVSFRIPATLIGLYAAALLLETLIIMAKTRKMIALLTPILLFMQHLMYNLGFIAGLFR